MFRPSTTHVMPLPADVRLLQATAQAVSLLAGVTLAAAAALWLVRLPVFNLKSVRVEGDVSRNSAHTLRANVAPKLAGNFLTLDLQRAREAFESVPWVRRAVVQRVWPNRLVVRLQEHEAAAVWASDDGNDKLVNTQGEVFEVSPGDVDDAALSVLQGPEGSAAQMLAMLKRLTPLLPPLNAGEVERLQLSARGSWQLQLDNGATLELGRGSEDEVLERTAHFVRTMPRVQATYARPLVSADLRHGDGFAVHLQGLGTAAPEPKPAIKPAIKPAGQPVAKATAKPAAPKPAAPKTAAKAAARATH